MTPETIRRLMGPPKPQSVEEREEQRRTVIALRRLRLGQLAGRLPGYPPDKSAA